MGSVTYTSRADTETIVKDAEDHEDVATTEKIICVSIVSVKVVHKHGTMYGACDEFHASYSSLEM